MAWTDVNFDEVNPGQELLPKGEYTFMVISAQRGKFDPEEVQIRLNVANPGPFQGQTVYARYPNPDKAGKGVPANDPRNWVNKAFKVFVDAMPLSMNRGEHPVDYVNRIVNQQEDEGGHIYIGGRIEHETYPDKETGETITRHKLVLRSITKAQVEAEA